MPESQSLYFSLPLFAPNWQCHMPIKGCGSSSKCSTPITETLLSEAQVCVLISSCALSQFGLGRLSETLPSIAPHQLRWAPRRDICKWTAFRTGFLSLRWGRTTLQACKITSAPATNMAEQDVTLLGFWLLGKKQQIIADLKIKTIFRCTLF